MILQYSVCFSSSPVCIKSTYHGLRNPLNILTEGAKVCFAPHPHNIIIQRMKMHENSIASGGFAPPPSIPRHPCLHIFSSFKKNIV